MITIYSLGDVEFMIRMALSAEMAFSDGGIGNSRLPGVALGVSLLIALFKQILDNKQFHIKTVFLSMILFMFMFMPKVPVVIESSRTGQLSAPITLPVGIAAGAWLSTGIGHGFAKGLMDSYSTGNGGLTNSSVGSSIEPLNALLKSRFAGQDTTVYLGEQPVNIEGYMEECVFRDIANAQTQAGEGTGSIDHKRLQNDPFTWSLLKVESNGTWFVDIAVNGSINTMSCENAWSYLEARIGDGTDWSDKLENNAMMLSGSSKSQVQEGLAIMMVTHQNSVDFNNQNMMKALYTKAGASSDWLSKSEVLAFSTQYGAMESRRMAQAAQSSFWLETAPALITWFESFIFLLAPLMPFLIALGDKGVGMFVKWMMILISVNVWPIVQVGVNLYNQYYVQKLLCGTVDQKGEIGSANCLSNPNMEAWSIETWGGMDAAFTQIETFVATAGMIQTMVPSLAMMIIYGSAHTMINATSQIQSGAKPDTAPLTPPPIKMSGNGTLTDSVGRSSSKTSDGWQANDQYGKSTTNDSPTFSGSEATTISNQSSSRQLESATDSHTAAVQNSVGSFARMANDLKDGSDYKTIASTNVTTGVGQGVSATKQVSEDTGEGTQAVIAKTITDASKQSTQEIEDFGTKLAAKAGMNLGEGGAGLDDPARTDRGGSFRPGKGGAVQKQIADNLLKALGISAGLTSETSWGDVKKTLAETAASLDNKYTAQESENYTEKFTDAIGKVDTNKFDQAKAEQASHGTGASTGSGVDWGKSKQEMATTGDTLQKAKVRSQELAEVQASADGANASASVKMEDLISSSEKAKQYHSADKHMEVAGKALDLMMQDKFGEGWQQFKGDDLNGALKNMAQGNAPKEMVDFAKYSGKLLDLATDKDLTQSIVNNAIARVEGHKIGNEVNGAVSAVEAVRKEAGVGKGVEAKAAGSVFTGTMLKDLAVNGNDRAGGVNNGITVGEAFQSNGLGLVVDHKPLETSEVGKKLEDKFDTKSKSTDKEIAKATDKLGVNLVNEYMKVQNQQEKVDAAIKAQKISTDDIDKREEQAKLTQAKMDTVSSDLEDAEKQIVAAEQKMTSGDGKNPSGFNMDSTNMFIQGLSNKYGLEGVPTEALAPAKEALINRDVAPKELQKQMADFMANPKNGIGDGENGNRAAAMATLAASSVAFIDKAEEKFKAQGKELPKDLKEDRAQLQSVVDQFATGKPANEQMRLSQVALGQAIEDGRPQDALNLSKNIDESGKFDKPFSTSDLVTSKYLGGNEWISDKDQFSNAVASSAQRASDQSLIRSMVNNPDLSKSDKGLVDGLKKTFDNDFNIAGEVPKALLAQPNGVTLSRDEGKERLNDLSGAVQNSGLSGQFTNQENLMKGIWTLSNGAEGEQVRGKLNSISTDFTSNGEQLANHLQKNPNQIEPLLTSIKDDETRSKVADGLVANGVNHALIPSEPEFKAGNNATPLSDGSSPVPPTPSLQNEGNRESPLKPSAGPTLLSATALNSGLPSAQATTPAISSSGTESKTPDKPAEQVGTENTAKPSVTADKATPESPALSRNNSNANVDSPVAVSAGSTEVSGTPVVQDSTASIAIDASTAPEQAGATGVSQTPSVDNASQSTDVNATNQSVPSITNETAPEVKIVEVESKAAASQAASNEMYSSSALSTNFDVAQAEGWSMKNALSGGNGHVNSNNLTLPADLQLSGPSLNTGSGTELNNGTNLDNSAAPKMKE